jgi:hypothetical protein
LSFNRTHSRVFTGLLTGHNTLKLHLHLMGFIVDPTCRKFCTEEEISVHILCECKALAPLRNRNLGFFFLEPVRFEKQLYGTSGDLLKEQGSYNLFQIRRHKGPVLRPRNFGTRMARSQIPFSSILFLCSLSISNTSSFLT